MEGLVDENGEELLTLAEACKELGGLSYWQFRRYRKQGLITAARHGRMLVVRQQWIRDYWALRTKEAQKERHANEQAHRKQVRDRQAQRKARQQNDGKNTDGAADSHEESAA